MKNMRVILIAALCLFLAHAAYAGGGRLTPESQAEKLSRALSNPEVVVGVYEFPDWEGRGPGWYDLKDGTHIQEYRGFLSGSRGWLAMRLIQPIKGETDNLVFFKLSPFLGYSEKFLPLHGSQWVLFLNPLLIKDGKVSPHISYYTDEDIKGIRRAKQDIVFELYDGPYGAVCIQWPEEHSPGATIVHSEELVDDLIAICSAMSRQGQKAEEESPLELKTSLGRDIAAVHNLSFSTPEEAKP